MKIKMWCGISTYKKEQTIDLLRDWGITDEEWQEYSDSFKAEIVSDWATNYIEIGYEELDG